MHDNQDWERELLERVFAMVETRQPTMAERMASIPVENYLSPERLAREQRQVFRRFPILVGFSCQVRKPGDFFTHDASGVPILVTRDQSGTLRAFLNVCRHRGAKLVEEPCGSGRSMFACRYHGWRYSSEGKLRAVPHLPGFSELNREQRGLVPLPVAELHGLIFARTAPGPEIDLDTYLGPLFNQFDTFGVPQRVVFESSTRPVQCNWKVMAETVLEAYHITTLHRKTGGLAFEENLMLFESPTPPHGRFVLPLRGCKRPEPQDTEAWKLLRHSNAFYWMFPNSGVLFAGPLANFVSFFPVGADRCVVRGASLRMDGPLDEETRARLQTDYEGYWATIFEDFSVTEGIQAGLGSGANRELVLGRFEYAIDKHLHSPLEDALEGRLNP
jgi:phenylpropionate dioxygenase-like ring-hydroxylating dioxygenase large terminal subunit